MSATVDSFLRSWPFDPWLLIALVVCAGIYLRGWLKLWRHVSNLPVERSRQVGNLPPHSRRWHGGQVAAFLGGLAAVYLALASPIEPFAALLLQVHMVQHLLLMMVAPPLIWLGAPMFPVLRGLPRSVRVFWIAPLLSSASLRRLFGRLTHPLTALPIFVAATWLWHFPPVYELAVRSSGWHYLQHVCFLGAALLFWYPVVRPYPSRPRWSPWLLLPYLILADLSNTILSVLLTFSNRVLYPYYAEVPRLGGLSVLEDQSAAGVLMWVPGSIAFLLPLFAICFRLLCGREVSRIEDRGLRIEDGKHVSSSFLRPRSSILDPPSGGRLSLPVVALAAPTTHHSPLTTHHFDLLRVPLLGRFLKWRHARLTLQMPLMALAGVVILDGLRGPQVGPMNLAGVLPWVHWRGLVILGLLALGNVFCMACPFTVPRTFARRWLPRGRSWPRWLRSKWLAVALLALFLWAYEAFSLWDSPWWTAWIVVGYFVAALVVDGFFRGASFCKYVCPIGQFNFVQSLVSPLEIKVRDPKVCASCQTKDCIRGRDGIPGCELNLFQPRKSSNMDCTFCLDCIHACPHDNVGIIAEPPGKTLWHDSFRSGLGRFSKRPDVAALVVVLTFGAYANAAGMVAPVLEWRDQLTSVLPRRSPLLVTSLIYVFGLLVLPALMVAMSAVLSRWLGQLKEPWLKVGTRFAFSLIPIGFGMWLAHYSFHFLGSFDAIIPALQRFAGDLGLALAEPEWQCDCCRPVADWLPRLEILFLDLGFLFSLYSGYRIARTQSDRESQTLKIFAPWALLIAFLFAFGVWIVLQPMQMRGTLLTAG
jgi:cytochrome c oxidase assembly factor CtaG/polyferredoxin